MMDTFSGNLKTNPDVLSYLRERGVTDKYIETGQIGFCPPYAQHWFAYLKGRIIVPIRDVHGSVVAFAGRIYDPMRPITERALWDIYGHNPADAEKRIAVWNRGKWLNEPFPKNRHLFQLNTAYKWARARDYIVIVEGYLDAIVLAQQGIQNTVAVCGVALSERHAALMTRYCQHAVILMDGDAAGDKGAQNAAQKVRDVGMIPHLIALPQGKDPDDVALYVGGKQLRKALETRLDEEAPGEVFNLRLE